MPDVGETNQVKESPVPDDDEGGEAVQELEGPTDDLELFKPNEMQIH